MNRNGHISELPRLTVITSTLNCATSLRKTASSIREQTYRNIQWIVADGASIDNTIEVIIENSDIVSNWFSSPDSGIYDAWNKACNFITGEWTIFLGAGDTFQAPDTIENCCRKIHSISFDYDFAFGNIKIRGLNSCHTIINEGEFRPVWMDLNYSTPPHSAVFTRSSILQNCPFDARLKIIGDKKFMISKSNNKYYNLETNVTIMDGFGISHDMKNIPVIWKENILISRDGPRAPFFHVFKAYLINWRNIFLIKMLGFNLYSKWFRE